MDPVKRVSCRVCDAEDRAWNVDRVIAEDTKRKLFCVEWEGICPHYRLPFAWSWEPRSDCPTDPRTAWMAQKTALRQAKAQRTKDRKAGLQVESPELKPLTLPALPSRFDSEADFSLAIKMEVEEDRKPKIEEVAESHNNGRLPQQERLRAEEKENEQQDRERVRELERRSWRGYVLKSLGLDGDSDDEQSAVRKVKKERLA